MRWWNGQNNIHPSTISYTWHLEEANSNPLGQILSRGIPRRNRNRAGCHRLLTTTNMSPKPSFTKLLAKLHLLSWGSITKDWLLECFPIFSLSASRLRRYATREKKWLHIFVYLCSSMFFGRDYTPARYFNMCFLVIFYVQKKNWRWLASGRKFYAQFFKSCRRPHFTTTKLAIDHPTREIESRSRLRLVIE